MTADTTEVTELSRMVAFALRWCAHGGGPAAVIRADFGMDTAAFFRTLVAYLDSLRRPRCGRCRSSE